MDDQDKRITLTVTLDQARAMESALDLMTRVGIGQFAAIAELVRMDVVPVFRMNGSRTAHHERQAATPEACDAIESLLDQAKEVLGYPRNASHGVGHPDNHVSVHRSYEVMKVLQKVLHEASAGWEGSTRGEGLLVRYTDDPEPEAELSYQVPVLR